MGEGAARRGAGHRDVSVGLYVSPLDLRALVSSVLCISVYR